MQKNESTPSNKDVQKSWFSLSIEESLKGLNSSFSGLSSEENKSRLLQFGPNEFQEEEKESPLKLLAEQFSSLLIIILIIAAIISAFLGDTVEAISIIIIVVLAGVLGFIQEYQAGKAIESLKKMAAPHANVLRDGIETNVLTRDIVPGEVLVIKTGDRIPADARIIEANNLRIDEASLTGESLSVEKNINKIQNVETSLGDRKNMVYMGTAVSYGRGKAVVTATGMKTEFGKIAGMLQSTETRKTPLQTNLDFLGKKIGIFAIILSAVMSIIGVIKGYAIQKMFVWGVALAVAVIPEALPAVVTISLALGVRRMVKRKALIRKLPAVETLGAINIICSDKTGTLTQDEMTIRKIYTGRKVFNVTGIGYKPEGDFFVDDEKIISSNEKDLKNLLVIGSLCNDTLVKNEGNEWDLLGDPTEGSIAVASMKFGLDVDSIRKQFPRVNEIPFSSERKRMTTVHKLEDGTYSFSKGAPEVILDSCNNFLLDGQKIPITKEEKKYILENAYHFGTDALRVLALSSKFLDDNLNEENFENEMTFVGLVGMMDPPRVEVKDAIKICESAGIKPIMITGDHKVTAVAVAKELGILRTGQALSGSEIEKIPDKDFDEVVDKTEVYARISPEHKLKIVSALIKKGNIVAMTGDGVNDAPSLKKADIGVAMGITGTDVSKEAADMILTDDNFASIVAAVEEGRSIFANIRKYLVFLLSGNMGTVFAMIIALLAGLPLPLDPVQILFINFIMDGLIAIALGVEPPEPRIMFNKPRTIKEGILSKKFLWLIFGLGVWISAITMGVFIWALKFSNFSEQEAVTIFFVTLILARLFNGFNCRSLEQSILRMKFFANKALIGASFLTVAMTAAVVYIEVFRKPFHVTPLTLYEWIGSFAFAITVLVTMEIYKIFARRFIKK